MLTRTIRDRQWKFPKERWRRGPDGQLVAIAGMCGPNLPQVLQGDLTRTGPHCLARQTCHLAVPSEPPPRLTKTELFAIMQVPEEHRKRLMPRQALCKRSVLGHLPGRRDSGIMAKKYTYRLYSMGDPYTHHEDEQRKDELPHPSFFCFRRA